MREPEPHDREHRDDVSDEIRAHIEHRADDLVRGGLSREEAWRRARLEFGGVERYAEEVRAVSWRTVVSTLPGQLGREARLAWRRLRASPLFTIFAVVTLALGIGVTTAVYTYLYAFIWQDVGVRNPDDVVTLNEVSGYSSGFSYPEFIDLKDLVTQVDGLGAVTSFGTALSTDEGAEFVQGEGVSGSVLTMLGVTPIVGRVIQPSDDRPDAPAIAVLSEAVWRHQLRADEHIVGKTVRLAGQPYEVVGVVPVSFRGLSSFGREPHAVWVPLRATPSRGAGTRLDVTNRQNRQLTLRGRLKPGATIERVRAEIAPLIDRLEAIDPMDRTGKQPPRGAWVSRAFADDRRTGRGEEGIRVILGIPVLVLLVACTNLANLVLSRGSSRLHEAAVRRALGASRARLIREQVIEGLMIAVAGGLGGLFVADRLLRFANDTVRDTFGTLYTFAQVPPGLEPVVLAAAGGLALVALFVSSVWPALQLTKISDRSVLATDTGTGAGPRWRQRSNLIALQVTISVCLFLVTAIGVTVLRIDTHDVVQAGLDHVGLIRVPFGVQQQSELRVRETIDRVMADMKQRPGVTAVAAASMDGYSSWSGGFLSNSSRPFGPGSTGDLTDLRAVTSGYFDITGRTLRAGRAFDGRDDPASRPVVILNRSLATKVLGPGDPIGRDVWLKSNAAGIAPARFQIVGVTEDLFDSQKRPEREAFVPFAQQFDPNLEIVARGSSSDVRPLLTALKTTLRRANPDVAVTFAGRADLASRWMPAVAMRMVTSTFAGLATLTLVLAMAGLFGVLSHVVSRRMREFGLRMALGADRRRIATLVVRQGFRPILEGLFMGAGAATIIRLAVQPYFSASFATFDVAATTLAAGPLLLAGALACYLPARRAARVDPNIALKDL